MKFFKKKDKEMVKNTKKNKKEKKGSELLTVQDLLKNDGITEKGIIKIDKSYILVMETDQTNTSLLDFDENASLWNNFRTMLNSINVRHSFILQSHFFDVGDFVKNYEEVANSLTNLTPELEFAKDDVIKGYWAFTEERNRDQRCYIIFRYNPDQEGIELSFETGNAMIDDFFKKAKSKTAEIDEEESRSIAYSVLEEIADLTYQLLHTLNIRSVRLNRLGVMNMIYSTLNRDLTTSQRIQDVSDAHSFTEMKVSETPSLIAEGLSENDDIQLFSSYDQNNLFETDLSEAASDANSEVLIHA